MAAQELPTIIASPSDQRRYKALKLTNGMRVVLIHDPDMGTGAEPSPLERHTHPGEDKVVADEDVENLMSEDDDSEDGSDGSDEESGSDEEGSGSDMSADGSDDEGHVRPHHPRALHHAGPVKKAAASVSVGIGHFSDPAHLPGLSHYLEHMLFMGSDKFPDENDYDAFLSANSGSSNAYTEEEATTFYFDCKPSALRGALERFSRFFVSPLVKADAMGREVQAVDNEFSGVLQSDSCRLSQLRAATSKPDHPFAKFGWGNRKSLEIDPAAAGIDVRSELLQYYSEQYAADRMGLVVLSGESLETLETLVKELFNDVPCKANSIPRPRFGSAGFPYTGGRIHLIQGVTEGHKLCATFQLPCLEDRYGKKADEYLSHLIGHEGSGSLLSALKARGLATDLCAGVSDQTSAAWLFEVSITLTKAGLTSGSGCGLEAAKLLFEYIAMLKAAGPQQWAFEEMKAIADLKFRFQEEEDPADYVAQIASSIHSYPVQHVLAGAYLHEEYDPVLITSLLGLLTPSAVRLDVQTNTLDECVSVLTNMGVDVVKGKEPWFDFDFVQGDIPSTVLESWATVEPSEDIHLPPRNDYLPTDFTLCCQPSTTTNEINTTTATTTTTATEQTDGTTTTTTTTVAPTFPDPPTKLLDLPGLRVWHKLDSTFKLPRTNTYFRLATTVAYNTPAAAASTHLLTKLLEDALCETTYLADVAGLQYTLWFAGVEGVDIKIDGFSHKLPILVQHVFQSLKNLDIKEDAFNRVKEALTRQYRNVNMKPIKHATYLRLRTLRENVWEVDAIKKELESSTVDSLRNFLPVFLENVHVEAYVHGNITATEAETLATNVRTILDTTTTDTSTTVNGKKRKNNNTDSNADTNKAFPTLESLGDQCLSIPTGASLLIRRPIKNPEEENSVVEIYYQGGIDSPEERAVVDLIDQLTHEPCYDVLRTKEQLGYTVYSGTRLTLGITGFCVVVQSGVHGPKHLESRVEAFLSSFVDRVNAMTNDEFEQQKNALLAAKLTKDRNMLEESDRGWEAITLRGCDFWQRSEEVEKLRQVTKQQVIERYEALLLPGSGQRKKLSVHIVGKAHLEAEMNNAVVDGGIEIFDNEDAVKEKYGLCPAVKERV